MPPRPTFPARLPPAHIEPGIPGAVRGITASIPSMRSAASSAISAARPAKSGVLLSEQANARQRMVQRLRTAGIGSTAVLAALQLVERHCFIDSAFIGQAYEDTSLPIGFGQTISKPSVVARMATLLTEAPITDGGRVPLGRVLEIGSGCGYQAALLARIATEVYSIERLRGLHELARTRLRPFRVANLHLLFGDGMLGFVRGAPYAGIVSAAGGTTLPQAWIDQLAIGGRLIAPTVTQSGEQALVVVDKTATGPRQRVLEGVHFVPLKSGIA